tara:strand:+ start:1861 stop:2790 length:930 start_codon:yes stop_codon:yes gene_type:complete
MNLKKPKFWDYLRPNIFAYILLPIAILIQLKNLFRNKSKSKNSNIKTICIGNIYIGGTGKTSLSIKINEILNKKNIRTCFIKKFYKNQIDEQKLLKSRGKLFLSPKRIDALSQAIKENYEIAILDDGLQDNSINYDVKLVCFNNLNWIGNGLTIPAGPLRENLNNLKNYHHVFLNGNQENLDKIKKHIYKINSKINIHIGQYRPLNMNEFDKKNKYLVFSGIGNHKTFISMIKNHGFNICKNIEFPDHYEYTNKDIKKILKLSEEMNCKIITTEKDYLRLEKNKIDQIKFIKSDLEITNEENFINSIIR